MAFSFSVKTWRKERPKSAEGSGVADAIGKVEKAHKKGVDQLSDQEVSVATDALRQLKSAFGVAKKKIQADKKEKDRSKILGLIQGWVIECETGEAALRQRAYRNMVQRVQDAHHEDFQRAYDTFTPRYNAAEQAMRAYNNDNSVVPQDKDVVNWMADVRAMGTKSTVDGLKKLSTAPEAKQIKLNDVQMHPKCGEVQVKVKNLHTWCEIFAKAAKRKVKGTADNAPATGKIADREFKNILLEYKQVHADNKALIARAKKLETTARQLADRIETEIGNGNTDSTLFGKINAALKKVAEELDKADKDMIDIHQTYRESSGDLSKRTKRFKTMEGYDSATHDKPITEAMNSAMMGVRRVTLPLGQGRTEIARAKRLLESSTSHRGYASGIKEKV